MIEHCVLIGVLSLVMTAVVVIMGGLLWCVYKLFKKLVDKWIKDDQ